MIWLIRHAEPARGGVLLGSSTIALARENIAPLALPAARIFTSPLPRALRTAQLLFPDRSLDILPQLAERGIGDWEHHTWDSVTERWPALAEQASADWFGTTPPGGETWTAFESRVRDAWNTIRAAPSAAVVAHAGVNAVLYHLGTRQSLAAFTQDYLEVIPLALSN